MVALIQGFNPEWQFVGKKTSVYRQIGNAFPPPVAFRVGNSIQAALAGSGRRRRTDPLFELEALTGAHA
jgi:DNA (cytosine-5)-methyltransferase 1